MTFPNNRTIRFQLKKLAHGAVLAASVVAGLAFGPAAAQSTRVIRNDGGGQVNSYLMSVNMAILSGERIRIEGWCASACTLYLASPNTCVTPGATLAFHAPRGGSAAQNRDAARRMAAQLPGRVGAWYLQNAAHLTGRDYAALSGADVVRMGGARYC